MALFCKIKGIKHVRSKPKHPWVNGAVERFNRTWGAFVKKIYYVNQHWTNYLTDFYYYYNNRVHSSTNKSPYSLFFGRDQATAPSSDVDCREPNLVCNIFEDIEKMSDEELNNVLQELNCEPPKEDNDDELACESRYDDDDENNNAKNVGGSVEEEVIDKTNAKENEIVDSKYFKNQPVNYYVPTKGKVSYILSITHFNRVYIMQQTCYEECGRKVLWKIFDMMKISIVGFTKFD